MPLEKKPVRKPPGRVSKQAERLESLTVVAAQLDGARGEIKSLQEDVGTLQDQALELMNALGIKEHAWKDATGKLHKINRQQTSSDIVDESRLRNRLGSAMWNKVTTRVLDKNKLKAHVASGEIEAKVIAECSTTKTNSPFVKVS